MTEHSSTEPEPTPFDPKAVLAELNALRREDRVVLVQRPMVQRAAIALAASIAETAKYEEAFALYHAAEMRGIKMWQEATGEALVWPDTGKLTVWLLEQLAETTRRLEALTLPKHRCEMVAVAQWNDVGGRAHWVGRLLEPIPGYEEETHCMHFVTPLKGEVVFGFIEADFHQLAALCEAASSHSINPSWLRLKAQDYIGNVRHLRQRGVKAALAAKEKKP